MIRCQQCGFDNPDIHKFCQKCGSALSEPENVSAEGEISEENTRDWYVSYPNSPQNVKNVLEPITSGTSDTSGIGEGDLGIQAEAAESDDLATTTSPATKPQVSSQEAAKTQHVWSAILFPSALNVLIPGMGDRLPQNSAVDTASQVAAIARTMMQRDYLDKRQRYQVLLSNFSLDPKALDLEMRVCDRDPSKPTVIERWAEEGAIGPDPDVIGFTSDWAEDSPITLDNDLGNDLGNDLDTTADIGDIGIGDIGIGDIGDIDDTPPRYEDVAAASNWSPSKAHDPDADTVSLGDRPEEDPNLGAMDSPAADNSSYDATAMEDDEDHEETDPEDEQQTLPAIAQIYLTVQNQLYPSLPQIHDAWIDDGCAVVLLEDRDHLSPLIDSLQAPNILPIQVLHWLHEMVELWAVVDPIRCRRSLLEIENLGVDEDQILCLKRLHLELPSQEASLQDLGHVWRVLLDGLPIVTEHGFESLYEDLESGITVTLDELRNRLEDAADRLHDDMSTSNMGWGAPAASTPSSPSPLTVDSATASGSPIPNFDLRWDDNMGVEESFSELYGDADEAPTIVLPMRMFSLTDAGLTDIGRQRDHNEDYFSINSTVKKQDTPSGRVMSARGLYILCDGMGGHAAGEVASALAVSTLQQHFEQNWTDRFPTQEEIRAAICEANQSIFDLNQQSDRQGSGRMGTTLVMMLIQDTKVAIAHVGDSRVYRFGRRAGLEQITIDHEVGQREIQRGADPTMAYARPDAYQLTQALGPRGEKFINPDIHFLDVNEDALFLLCSDGLSDNDLLEQYFASHVEPMLSSQAILETELQRLVELANEHNGHDNITAVAVRVKMRPKLQGSPHGGT